MMHNMRGEAGFDFGVGGRLGAGEDRSIGAEGDWVGEDLGDSDKKEIDGLHDL